MSSTLSRASEATLARGPALVKMLAPTIAVVSDPRRAEIPTYPTTTGVRPPSTLTFLPLVKALSKANQQSLEGIQPAWLGSLAASRERTGNLAARASTGVGVKRPSRASSAAAGETRNSTQSPERSPFRLQWALVGVTWPCSGARAAPRAVRRPAERSFRTLTWPR